MTIKEAADRIGKTEQFLRIWIKQGTCPFGFLVTHQNRCEYIISEKKLNEYF